ncbi:hypothetical protein TOPH_02361 [Tolypocladium ophioglossoides CBS 100239]|uniref:Uncharacterized protein n=1 Tax=Tolypocladium ophioglossoides (strain CBS 100239) TaxID=1163406 RepID=A0A0L0NG47_TOLOC|nr:hypothetical protein TOPH_02361 [Tolypocladium ophioglossoides CBS 100239]
MKFSTILAGTFAAVVAAAPAPASEPESEAVALEARNKSIDVGRLNNLNFKQQDLNYLFRLNSVDLQLFQHLGINNNFNVVVFHDLFNGDNFNINALLQFQQMHTLLAIASTGVFNTFDLSKLNLGGINMGLINGVGGVDLGQFIDVGVRPQVAVIAGQGES